MKFNSLFLIYNIMDSIVGWGREGHVEVARYAYRHTTNKGRKFLKVHGFEDIRAFKEASGWADTDEALREYPGSDDYHFSNTPWRNCQPFVYKRDCGYKGSGRCIVSAIANMVKQAVSGDHDIKVRTDAIKFIAHFMADIHQPLHTGFVEDAGGVHIGVDHMSLHQLWDYGLLDSIGVETAVASLASASQREPVLLVPKPEELNEKIFGYTASLASESSLSFTCRYAYQFDDGSYIVDHVTPEYLSSRSRIAAERLRTAGKRLAQLLDVMAQSFTLNTRPVQTVSGGGAAFSDDAVVARNYFDRLRFDFDLPQFFDSDNDTAVITHLSESSIPSNTSSQVLDRNVSEYVVVKSRGRLVFTCRGLVASEPAYEPLNIFTQKVKIVGTERRVSENIPVVFLFDKLCFSRTVDSDELIMLLIHVEGCIDEDHEDLVRFRDEQRHGLVGLGTLRLQLVDAVGKRSPDGEERNARSNAEFELRLYMKEGREKETLRTSAELDMYASILERHGDFLREQTEDVYTGGRYLSLQHKWTADFQEKSDKIVRVVFSDTLRVFLHIDTIENTKNLHVKFLVFNMINARDNTQYTILIDSNIYVGAMTREILNMIANFGIERDQDYMHAFAFSRRRSLYQELALLDWVLNRKQHGRSITKQPTFVDHLFIYSHALPDGESTIRYKIVEYTLSKQFVEKMYNQN